MQHVHTRNRFRQVRWALLIQMLRVRYLKSSFIVYINTKIPFLCLEILLAFYYRKNLICTQECPDINSAIKVILDMFECVCMSPRPNKVNICIPSTPKAKYKCQTSNARYTVVREFSRSQRLVYTHKFTSRYTQRVAGVHLCWEYSLESRMLSLHMDEHWPRPQQVPVGQNDETGLTIFCVFPTWRVWTVI